MADKIAIFGGSFNPIHNGHIAVARHALLECRLKKVIFLPNANPPHKDKTNLISSIHRYNMVSLAIDGIDEFEISDYEMNKDKPSYTIDTMRYMKSKLKGDLYFIIGADSLYTLNLWKSYNELIKECSFIVADRNCHEGDDLKKEADYIKSQGGRVHIISMPKIDFTSTDIRNDILKGRDISHSVPSKVNEYILENQLYRSYPEDKR